MANNKFKMQMGQWEKIMIFIIMINALPEYNLSHS